MHTHIQEFYETHLPGATVKKTQLVAPCPFCLSRGFSQGTIGVTLNKTGYFLGYFRCSNRCVPGGFAHHFARLRGIDPEDVPGFDLSFEPFVSGVELPLQNINQDVLKFKKSMTQAIRASFAGHGIGEEVLEEMQVGFNGRYLVYPYFQDNGCAYAAHCLSPDGGTEESWYGNEDFSQDGFRIFNQIDIHHCQGGALFVVEGEDNLLCLRQLGFPGIGVATAADLAFLETGRFHGIKTVFLVVKNNPESQALARAFGSRLGFKVRLLLYPSPIDRKYDLTRMAREDLEGFHAKVLQMVASSKAFSPFLTPEREYAVFVDNLEHRTSASYLALQTGFPQFDAGLGGVHGINIIGGAPKAGKSCLSIQLGTMLAEKKVPVIYYDFENGRQKIYQRTLSRLSQIKVDELQQDHDGQARERLMLARETLKGMLEHFRVVNDRAITPEIMRRHVDFIRHETGREDAVVVIDSLHKLPFKDFSERRTGIDAWLRELESIRDEYRVAFIVISELSRQEGDRYDGVPHMGWFKGSGDIEYTADNALVFAPDWDPVNSSMDSRVNSLWLVASREHSPGLLGNYHLDYPYWGFSELEET
ncbi:MAG: AAA family ATPase [Desulfobulbaceae bacterium]|jgi:replicative DNA helicase|nr:AAA family ATPase [Desulfobulbaceae bacterium]